MLDTCAICDVNLVDVDGYDSSKHGLVICERCDPTPVHGGPRLAGGSERFAWSRKLASDPIAFGAVRAAYRLGGHQAVVALAREATERESRLRAAAQELLDLLHEACGSLDAAERASRSHATADRIRRRCADLGLWRLQGDNEREESSND